ncbi:MAG: M20/M25/M40 family metallo-hydrolase [Myxococcota bacterium]
MASRAIELLRDYVAIPSVNPMGRDDVPPSIAGEARYAEHVAAQLRAMALDAVVVGAGDRRSVVAEATAAGARDTVLVASHLDTVPVDGMEIDPFDPRIANERLYGRGACDTKAGMAALVAALQGVLARGTLRRNVVVVGEADEELGSAGVADVLAHLGGRRPDWVLATEPTSLRVVNEHKGIALARVAARGVACHGSNPRAGRNALGLLARAILAFEELADELAARPHGALGPATLSPGIGAGGHAPNIVPDRAWVVLDRRMVPGETVDGVRAELEAALARRGLEHVVVERCESEKGPLGTPADHVCVRRCRNALAACGARAELGHVAFGTDAGAFALHGIPGVVMGPGSIERAHTAAEYVETPEVEAMTRFFTALLESAD